MPDQISSAAMWFRRDLRLADNPALLAACAAGTLGVLPLFVLDPALWGPAGPARRGYLSDSLRALDESLGGRLTVLEGNPVEEVVRAAREIGADTVHVCADYGPCGSRRDDLTERALIEHGIALHRLGSPYAVAPGTVRTGEGRGYRVFTPFSRAWADHGFREPVVGPDRGTLAVATRPGHPRGRRTARAAAAPRRRGRRGPALA